MRKKQRGQERKLKRLFNNIDIFHPYNNITGDYEHFHVPCSNIFLDSKKTSNKIKKQFCQKWLDTSRLFIKNKPSDLIFCKVVSLISANCLWDSQIIIFYNQEYYNNFWNRNSCFQKWTKISDSSFVTNRGLLTSLKEVCYLNEINDDDYSYCDYLWFYGEIPD